MLITVFIITLLLLISLTCWCVYMYDVRIPHIPESESEKRVREIKLRIEQAEWKFRNEQIHH